MITSQDSNVCIDFTLPQCHNHARCSLESLQLCVVEIKIKENFENGCSPSKGAKSGGGGK